MTRAVNRHNGDRTNFMDQRRDTQETLAYLAMNNKGFFREMYALLYQGGYLEKKTKPIETNAPQELLDS